MPTKLLRIGADFHRKQRQGNTYWIAWSLGPRDRMNAWHRQRWGHQTIGTGSYVSLSLSLFLSLSLSAPLSLSPPFSLSPSLSPSLYLSELCAKNGQCLCARQNFNEGGRRWRWWAKRRSSGGAGVGRGRMPHNKWQDEEFPQLKIYKRMSCLTHAQSYSRGKLCPGANARKRADSQQSAMVILWSLFFHLP